VKSRNVIRYHRPLQGLVAFVPRSAAMAAMHMNFPIGHGLDRMSGPLNPGERSA
jgi:hypothetical protein